MLPAAKRLSAVRRLMRDFDWVMVLPSLVRMPADFGSFSFALSPAREVRNVTIRSAFARAPTAVATMVFRAKEASQ
jgi:hypothetical protein